MRVSGPVRPAVTVLLAVLCLTVVATSARAATVAHDVRVMLQPEQGEIRIVHSLSVSGSRPVRLTLPDRLTVEGITVDDRPMPRVDGRSVEIEPGTADPRRVVATYGARPWPGTPARGPFISKDGAFLPGGSDWLLVADADQQTWQMHVAVGLPYRAVVTGRLTAESESDGVYQASFTGETPLEPPSLFAGRFEVRELEHKGLRLRTYFGSEQARLADAYLSTAAEYIDLFADRIGDYPFSGFSMVAAPLPVGLGFPGLTYISERILPLPFMLGRSLAHEIAHNWWGNGVGVDYASGNWAEGLTSFMADYGLAERTGADRAAAMRLEWLRDFAALPSDEDLPLRAFVYKSHDAAQIVGYGKAAFLFHMLRDELGAAVFDAALQRFWREARFTVASWDDLRLAFEAQSGTDLGPFFAQWLDRAGAPTIELVGAEPVRDGAAHAVTVRLSQNAPAYALAVPVRVTTDQGETVHHVALAAGRAEAKLNLPARPRSLAIDPRHDLFRHLAPGEAPPILRDVTLDPDSAVHIDVGADDEAVAAAEALAGRLLSGGAGGGTATPNRSTLLVTLDERLDATLDAMEAGPVPATLSDAGTARVWTARRDNDTAVVVVTARDGAALQALVRPLPHYKRQSYLVFDGSRAVERGVWSADAGGLTRVFD